MRLLPAIVCRIKGMPNSGILALLPLVCHTAIAILGILVRDSSWRNTTISEISSILPPRIYYTWFHSMCYTWFDFVSSMLRICFYLLCLFVYIMWILVWKTTDSNQKYSFVSLAPLPSRAEMRYLGRKIIAVTSSAVRAILAEEENVTCEFFMKLPFLWSMKTKFLQ